jgi:hypothetical protein
MKTIVKKYQKYLKITIVVSLILFCVNAAFNQVSGSSFVSDTVPPTVSITAPADGLKVSGTLSISASAFDNVGLVGVQFKVDEVDLGPEDTTSPYSVDWDTTKSFLGVNTITAVARDASGNYAVSGEVNVIVIERPLPKDGTIIKDLNNSSVYIMEHGLKRPFSSLRVFERFGYNLSRIKEYDTSLIPSGEPLTTHLQRHVRGINVSHNGTIYFMGSNLRYAYPSMAVFESWKNELADVVPANSYDLLLPLGPAVK